MTSRELVKTLTIPMMAFGPLCMTLESSYWASTMGALAITFGFYVVLDEIQHVRKVKVSNQEIEGHEKTLWENVIGSCTSDQINLVFVSGWWFAFLSFSLFN